MAEHDASYIKIDTEQYNFRDDTKLPVDNPSATGDLTVEDDIYFNGGADSLSTQLGAKADSSSLAAVATSGDYDDLINKPTIPTDAEDIDYDNTVSGLIATDVQAAIDEIVAGGTADPTKMDKVNPTGSGSFSLNRKSGTTVGNYSFAEGYDCTASGINSHAEGYQTVATRAEAHAEGNNTIASGDCSHAEGQSTTASGARSHAEGDNTTASGDYSHAEGYYTEASGDYSHAEGQSTTASGARSHAEGYNTTASGDCSHAEGYYTEASGARSHAEGYNTTASGDYSHAEGQETEAASAYQHVSGKFNIVDNADTYAEIIGNGTAVFSRSNARTLDWSGNETIAGDLYFNGGGTGLSSQLSAKADAADLPSDSGYKDDFADVSLASNTSWSTLASFNLTKGVWLVEIAAEFQNNNANFRGIGLYVGTSTPSSPSGIRYSNTIRAADGAVTNMTMCMPIDINSDRTIYILGRQNSGTTLTTKPRACWVKIMPR